MYRNPARVAVLWFTAALALSGASSAQAWPFGGSKTTDATKPDDNTPKKATPEQRAAAQRLDPLARAAFWQHELVVDPRDPDAGVGLSAALRGMGKFDEAADTADRTIMVAPKNEEALLESARAHIAGGHGFYAIQPLKDARTVAPKDWRPVSLMGVALEQSQRPDEALTAYNQALKLSPNNPAVLSNLALFYATRNDPVQGEALLRRAVAQPSATAQERQNLALVLGLEGKTAEAEHLMRQDLPPEVADANLAYFKTVSGPPSGSGRPADPAIEPAGPPARTWGSVQAPDPKGG